MDKKNMNNLILTADDFGISEQANMRILKLVRLGKIDRVAVIAHGNISSGEKKELLDSGIKLDVHFNITEDFTENRKVHEGAIKGGSLFLLKFLAGKYNSKKVYNNWDKDVRLFIEKFGKIPDGISSHQHVHFFPPFFKIVLKLKKRYGIPFVRFGSMSILGNKNTVKHILNILRLKDKKIFARSDFQSTEYFVSLDWINDVDKFLQKLPQGKVEIACHPERDEEFETFLNYF